jgi:hypothetical protein
VSGNTAGRRCEDVPNIGGDRQRRHTEPQQEHGKRQHRLRLLHAGGLRRGQRLRRGIKNAGTLSLSKSTIGGTTSTAGNVACTDTGCFGQGGGIYNDSGTSTVTLTNDTITFNAAFSGTGSGDGGGIFNNSGSPTLQNDIIAHNTPDNCAPPNSDPGCSG